MYRDQLGFTGHENYFLSVFQRPISCSIDQVVVVANSDAGECFHAT